MLNDDKVFSVDNYLSNKLNMLKNDGGGLYPPFNGQNIKITATDFNMLSKYEKGVIATIANIYGLLNGPNKEVSYNTLMQIMDKWARDKGDVEKEYILSLLFPERVKNAAVIYPFPIPTYTYVQKFQFPITPNNNGCFLIQATCPYMVDTTQVGISNVFINSSAALNGVTIDNTAANYIPQTTCNVVPGQFQAYSLQCAKLSVRYVGRLDVASGYFGGSYFLSTVSEAIADRNASLFNYIDDSINAVIVDKSEGLNVVYFPPDYSYLNFNQVNRDNTLSNTMSTSVRLNIYGNSLPGPNIDGGINNNNNGIIATWVVVWSVLPTAAYADLLPLNYDVQLGESSKHIMESSKFVPASGLTTYKSSDEGNIQRMLSLPKHIVDDAVKELGPIDARGSASNRKNVLDILKPLLIPNPQNIVYWDKDQLLSMFDNIKDKKTSSADFMNHQLDRKYHYN